MKILSKVLSYERLRINDRFRGWGNGYIGVPPNHPWYKKVTLGIPASVHRGITFSRLAKNGKNFTDWPEDYWVIGFDTAHYQDSPVSCPQSYVEQETNNLLLQAEQVYNEVPFTVIYASCDQEIFIHHFKCNPDKLQERIEKDYGRWSIILPGHVTPIKSIHSVQIDY